MASIEKLETAKGTVYQVRWRDPNGKQRAQRFDRWDPARRHARDVERAVDDGTYVDRKAGRITFRDWWSEYQSTTVNLRPSTRARDASYGRSLILPHLGHHRLTTIDVTVIRRWVAELEKAGKAPSTIHKAHQLVNKTLRAAVHAKRIASNPCEVTELPKVEHREMRFLMPAEITALAHAIGPRYRALVLLGGYGGLRIGEMAGLRRERVDLLRRRVEVAEIAVEVRGEATFGPPKTSAGRRVVPIPRVVASALEERLSSVPEGGWVFAGRDGGPLRASAFRRRKWAPAVKAAGLEPLRIHDLRHTAVALWIAAGASPKEIATWAGHRSVSTVLDRYGHLIEGVDDRVTDALDKLAEGSSVTDARAEVRELRPAGPS